LNLTIYHQIGCVKTQFADHPVYYRYCFSNAFVSSILLKNASNNGFADFALMGFCRKVRRYKLLSLQFFGRQRLIVQSIIAKNGAENTRN